MSSFSRIAFIASDSPNAQNARQALVARYGDVGAEAADVIVALGGDGLILQTLHRFMDSGIPIYGMHRGSIGFMMNEFREEGLRERLNAAVETIIHPLRMEATDIHGEARTARAVNEVSLFRQTHQVAKLRILVDGKVRLDELAADGVLVATPAGSTAYNLSAHGPILPLNAPLLALTPMAAFRPRRWRGALLPDRANVTLEVLEPTRRPVAAVADHDELRDVTRVNISLDHECRMVMLHDPDQQLEERIIAEQFSY